MCGKPLSEAIECAEKRKAEVNTRWRAEASLRKRLAERLAVKIGDIA